MSSVSCAAFWALVSTANVYRDITFAPDRCTCFVISTHIDVCMVSHRFPMKACAVRYKDLAGLVLKNDDFRLDVHTIQSGPRRLQMLPSCNELCRRKTSAVCRGDSTIIYLSIGSMSLQKEWSCEFHASSSRIGSSGTEWQAVAV